MSNIICCIIFGFFIILGISELITTALFHFFKTTATPETICAETIEYVLRSNIFQNKSNMHSQLRITALRENGEKEIIKIYETFMRSR